MTSSSCDQAFELYALGVAAATDGDHDLAITYFNRSLDVQPHFKTHHALARSLEARGAHVEAFRNYERAYHLSSRNDRAAVDYARCLLARSEKAVAAAILEAVLQRNSTYGPAMTLLAMPRQ